MSQRYDAPGTGAKVFNAAVRRLAEVGVSVQGSTVVSVRGRKTGRPRSVVVNLLTVDDRDYLVSPRGNTQWARNVRAAGEIDLGPRRRARRRRVVEIGDEAKPALLQRYVARWYWQVKSHMGGLTPDSGPAELRSAAPSIPVFEVV